MWGLRIYNFLIYYRCTNGDLIHCIIMMITYWWFNLNYNSTIIHIINFDHKKCFTDAAWECQGIVLVLSMVGWVERATIFSHAPIYLVAGTNLLKISIIPCGTNVGSVPQERFLTDSCSTSLDFLCLDFFCAFVWWKMILKDTIQSLKNKYW